MRIPSTQALRAFDSFARNGSVWRAADELSLTNSAVSHQLRLLEREIGYDLFRRDGKALALSTRGRQFAEQIRKALTEISDALIHYDGRGVDGPLTVSCAPGFASLWLCNHISQFQEMFPEVSLRIVTPRRLDEITDPDADLFIAFGDGNWPNRHVEPLCEVQFTPLCSPTLLNKFGNLNEPSDVLRAPLLHLVNFDEWTRWLASANVEYGNLERGVVFSDMNLVFSAAIAGQGIAMGDELTSGNALKSGLLIRPFDLFVKSPHSYFLVSEYTKARHAIFLAFSDWLKSRLHQTAPTFRPIREAT